MQHGISWHGITAHVNNSILWTRPQPLNFPFPTEPQHTKRTLSESCELPCRMHGFGSDAWTAFHQVHASGRAPLAHIITPHILTPCPPSTPLPHLPLFHAIPPRSNCAPHHPHYTILPHHFSPHTSYISLTLLVTPGAPAAPRQQTHHLMSYRTPCSCPLIPRKPPHLTHSHHTFPHTFLTPGAPAEPPRCRGRSATRRGRCAWWGAAARGGSGTRPGGPSAGRLARCGWGMLVMLGKRVQGVGFQRARTHSVAAHGLNCGLQIKSLFINVVGLCGLTGLCACRASLAAAGDGTSLHELGCGR